MEDQTELYTQRSVSPLSHASSGLRGPSLDDHERVHTDMESDSESGTAQDHHERVHADMGSDSESGTAQDHQSILERSRDNEKLAPVTKDSRYTRATSLWSRLETDWWIKEISAMLISILSLLCIVVILRMHEGRRLPDWPFSITINSLVSIFSTIMGMTILVPLEQCISQAKWHWFQEYHPLVDMDIYDQGSRGPWGALRMLWDIRWKYVSSLGALITVFALAIDPFAQQVASYQLEELASSQNSTLPVRFYFPNDLDENFKGAAIAGLFGSGQNTFNPYCPSGNCTWAPYQTLALCSQCVNVTSLIKTTPLGCERYVDSCDFDGCDQHVDFSSCFFSLPNGLGLKASGRVESAISGTLPPMMLDRVGYAIVNFSLLDITDSSGAGESPWAVECSLYWCINTYTATVNDGRFSERLDSSWYNTTSTLPLASIPSEHVLDNSIDFKPDVIKLYNTTPPTGGAKSQPNLNLSVDEMDFQPNGILEREDFLVSSTPQILNWLGSLLSGNSTTDDIPSNVVVDLFHYGHGGRSVPGISNVFIAGVQDTFDQLAQSLATWMRTSQGNAFDLSMGQAVGVTWTSETILKVRWAWLVLPCVLLAGTLVFLCFTMIMTRKQQMGIWKSSSLALLFHGLEERSAEGMEGLGHVDGMEERAGRTWVRLVDKGEGARLIERSGLPKKDS